MGALKTSSATRRFSFKEIYDAMIDYKVNMNRLEGIVEELNDVYQGLVAQGGIESTMPKAKGGVSDIVFREYQRREAAFNRRQCIVDRINLIEKFCVSEEFDRMTTRDKEMLDMTLDGKTFSAIAKEFGMHPGTPQKIVKRIALKIEQFQFTL